MKKNKPLLLVIIAIMLVVSIVVATSYALWTRVYKQNDDTIVNSDCFNITFTDSNNISLSHTLPYSDEEALDLTPYTFTIKNICNHNASFNVNIETLDDTTLDANYLRVRLDNEDSKLLSEYDINENKIIENAISSRIIETNILFSGEEKTYNLRLYVDEASTVDQSTEKTYHGKVTLDATLNRNYNLVRLLANGGKFDDDSTSKIVSTSISDIGKLTKIVHSDNVNDQGVRTGAFSSYLAQTKTVSIDGAAKLHVKINYYTGATYNYVCIYTNSQTVNTSCNPSISGKLYSYSLNTNEFDVTGSTAKFYFKTSYNSSSSKYYGYYATVTGYDENGNSMLDYNRQVTVADLPTPSMDGYVFNGWYTNQELTNQVTDDTLIAANTNVLYAKYVENAAIFDAGSTVNSKWKTLAKGSNTSYYSSDTLITSIIRSDTLDNTENIVSTSDSINPIYTWYDNGTIYWYSDSPKIYLNSNSSNMFYYLTKVTSLDLSSFDTSKVTNMGSMFYGMSSLTSLDLSSFDTSNVTNMSYMFSGMSGLTSIDLSPLNTTNVTNMYGMFRGMSGLTSIDLSPLNTTNVTSMQEMFSGMSGLTSIDLSPLDTSNVTNMYGMFLGMSGLTSIDLSPLNTSNVTGMSTMFSGMTGLTSIDLSPLDTTNVTNMSNMFKNMSSLTSIDLSPLDTSNVINMSQMFYKMTGLTSLDLSSFDTSKVTNMSQMFYSMTGLTSLNLSNFNTSNVTDMYGMFYGMSSLTSLDLSSFDTSSVVRMGGSYTSDGMFSYCTNLQRIYVNASKWNTNAVTSSTYMFYNDTNLVGGAGTTYSSSYTDKTYARIDGGPTSSTPGYLTDIADKP